MDQDSGEQCLYHQYTAVWQQDLNNIYKTREEAKQLPPTMPYKHPEDLLERQGP